MSLAFVRGIHLSMVNSPPVKRKYFHLMTSSLDQVNSVVNSLNFMCHFYAGECINCNICVCFMVYPHKQETVRVNILRPRQIGRQIGAKSSATITWNRLWPLCHMKAAHIYRVTTAKQALLERSQEVCKVLITDSSSILWDPLNRR